MAAGLSAAGGGAADQSLGHPLLGRLVEDAPDRWAYETTFDTSDSWVVDEHRLLGDGLVPGTAYLELARAVTAARRGSGPFVAQNVLFQQPVVVPDGSSVTVRTSVTAAADGFLQFAVRSRTVNGAWVDHCTGTVAASAPTTPPLRDVARLRDAPVSAVLESEDDFATHLKLDGTGRDGSLRFTFGPRWRQSLRRIEVQEGRMVATLTLPEEYRGDLEHLGLHPALLDLAGAAARIVVPDVYFMPFMYGRLEYHAPMTSTVLCAITVTSADVTETMTCDLEVLDPDGRLLVSITGLTIKRVADLDAVLAAVRDRGAPAADGDSAVGVLLESGIGPADAARALDAVLSASWLPARLAVARTSVEEMRHSAQALTPAAVAAEVARRTTGQESHPRPDLDTPFTAPSPGTETVVAAVWQDVLGVEPVGAHDDYFALGGHSLAAVQIGTRLRQELGVELDLRAFFERPTVAGTAELIDATMRPGAGDSPDGGIPVLTRVSADADPDDLAALVDGMSDAEVELRLRELLSDDEAGSGFTAPGRDS